MDKAYIISNKEQELDVLKKMENKGINWYDEKATAWLPSENVFDSIAKFPYVLIEGVCITWGNIEELKDEEIVYDGRKEEKMSDKYSVTKEFMDKLVEWRENEDLNATSGTSWKYINDDDLAKLPRASQVWWFDDKNPIERNNRLIAIIQWLNGEDVFKVEAPHKFIIKSEHTKSDGDYSYVKVSNSIASPSYFNYATKFDTREEAQEWANSHQVVAEIDEEGNEVE